MIIVLSILAVVFILTAFFGAMMDICTKEIVEDFARTFPDKCLICSMARYERRDLGIYRDVEPHECKEGNSK